MVKMRTEPTVFKIFAMCYMCCVFHSPTLHTVAPTLFPIYIILPCFLPEGRGFLYVLEFFVFLLTRHTCIGIMQTYHMGYGKRRCMKKKVDSFMEKLEHLMEIGGTKKDIVLFVISGVATILSLLGIQPLPFDIMCVAIILCGVPIVMEAIIGLVTEFDIKADVLVSLALIASVCIGEYFAAGEVAVIMQLGSLLEELTVAKARAGIERLVRLTPRTARVISGGTERVKPAQEVRVGDVLRVLPGESVPVEGIITAGQTSVNQAVMTGESLPVDKAPGDEVSSGTVNQFGAFDMRATRVGENSSIQRMIRLVQPADAGKAKLSALLTVGRHGLLLLPSLRRC